MNIHEDTNATFKLLQPEFEKIGYSLSEAYESGLLYVTFTSPSGKKWRFRASRIGYPFTSAFVKELSVHKEKAYEYAEALHISIPSTYHVDIDESLSDDEATRLIAKHHKLIVKPSNSSLSRGLTLNIDTKQKLDEAIEYSRTFKEGVIIQEQVEGEEIRFILIEGKVRAALLRQTARVVGDGVSSIAKLIEKENEVRKTLVFPRIKYPLLTEANISKEYIVDATVLPAGVTKELNRATMIKNGSSIYNVLSEVHPSYIEAVEKLAGKLDTRFLAADFFFKDYTAPLDDSNYWFIELNTSPVLKLCYGCRDGKMFDVVPQLVTTIDRWLHR
jgi:hypothetical protein